MSALPHPSPALPPASPAARPGRVRASTAAQTTTGPGASWLDLALAANPAGSVQDGVQGGATSVATPGASPGAIRQQVLAALRRLALSPPETGPGTTPEDPSPTEPKPAPQPGHQPNHDPDHEPTSQTAPLHLQAELLLPASAPPGPGLPGGTALLRIDAWLAPSGDEFCLCTDDDALYDTLHDALTAPGQPLAQRLQRGLAPPVRPVRVRLERTDPSAEGAV